MQMKEKLISVFILLILSCTFIYQRNEQSSLRTQFQQWSHKHNKNYQNDMEKYYRYSIFVQNYQQMKQHNEKAAKGLSTYTMGLNFYSDILDQEYKSKLKYWKGSGLSITAQCLGTVLDTPNPPEALDWIEKKTISNVSQLEICPSSWAYAAVEAVQGLYKIKKGNLQTLSTAQVIQCSGAYGNEGCKGGFMEQAFWYIIDQGIALNSKYKVKDINQDCHYLKSDKFANIAKCASVPSGNYSKLLSAIVQQPVAVAVDSAKLVRHEDGIFDGQCGTDLDRGMLLVGYGVEDQVKFWILKYSRQAEDEKGYIRILRKEEDGPGKCGIQLAASVPQYIA